MQETFIEKKPSKTVRFFLSGIFGMAKKFIIQGDNVVFGEVKYHRDLFKRETNDLKNRIIFGGGHWCIHIDQSKNKVEKILLLYGESVDYGRFDASRINKLLPTSIKSTTFDNEIVNAYFVSKKTTLTDVIQEYNANKTRCFELKTPSKNTSIKNEMTPKEFLESKGIDLQLTVFNTVIDGRMRQPDLCVLFDEYANKKRTPLS